MEGLIPLLITLVIGFIFNNKKKSAEDGQEKAKPFTAGSDRHDGPVKKLKEMSRDMYKEIQKELERETEKQQPTPQTIQRTIPKQEVNVTPKRVEVSVPIREQRTEPTRNSRVSRVEMKRVETKQSRVSRENLMPKSPDDIMKGVIFAEIFGPPKSKR